MNFLLLLPLITIHSPLFSQTRVIDSVRHVIQTIKDDTNKVWAINSITTRFWRFGLSDSAKVYGQKAIDLAKKLGFRKGLGRAYTNLGVVYIVTGNYPPALKYDSLAYTIYIEMADRKGQSRVLDNEGSIYDEEGNYAKSLECYFKALAIGKEDNDTDRIAATMANIGGVYDEEGEYATALQFMLDGLIAAQKLHDDAMISNDEGNIGNVYIDELNYPKALEYYQKALDLAEKLKDKYSISRLYGNIGDVYSSQHNYQLALKDYLKALNMKQELGDKNGVAFNLSNIGTMYSDMQNTPAALDFGFKALNTYRELGDKDGIARSMGNIGIENARLKKTDLAMSYLDSGLSIASSIGDLGVIKDCYKRLSEVDSATGKYADAFHHFKLYKVYYDSIVNSANTKKNVQAEMNFEFQQKQEVEKAEQEKKDVLAEQEHKKQVIIRNAFVGGFILMLALAFFIFRGYREKQKANEIITRQKEMVEEKQKEILDSIHYAQRIQKALLASEGMLAQNLPEHFVLFKPKDIVSGDFYWATSSEGRFYLAVCDSTGHGVPGAFMSLLNISFLNEAINEKKLTAPNEIFNHARKRLIENISQEGQQDGMDGTLLKLQAPHTLSYSAAYNPPIIIRNGELIELEADKIPVGASPKQAEPFTLHNFALQKGDLVYTFTDGYGDQFGGEKGKKLKYRQVLNLLLTYSKHSLAEQKELLEKAFDTWKGNLEQIDDVLVIGIKV
jgi:serine phosphatase RsbU (regulator of sigma subunit)